MQGWAPARIEGLKPTSGTVRKTMRSAACECSDGARTSSVGYHRPAAASEDHCTDLRATFSGKPLKFQRSSSIHDATQRLTLRPRCYCPRRRLLGGHSHSQARRGPAPHWKWLVTQDAPAVLPVRLVPCSHHRSLCCQWSSACCAQAPSRLPPGHNGKLHSIAQEKGHGTHLRESRRRCG